MKKSIVNQEKEKYIGADLGYSRHNEQATYTSDTIGKNNSLHNMGIGRVVEKMREGEV